jgi:hypothetical protein
MTMFSISNDNRTPATLRADLLLVALLVALGVAARLAPHALNFSPIVASALFAGVVLHRRGLSPVVPLAAMFVSDLALGFDHWPIAIVVYAAMTLPALVGILARRWRLAYVVLPAVLSCSLIFYVTTNFAVWAFGGLYSLDMAGLVQCYVAALPFLKHTIAGDLFWSAVLFGGAWLIQHMQARNEARATVNIRR